MNPATPAITTTAGKLMAHGSPVEVVGANSSCWTASLVGFLRMNCHISTLAPTIAFKPAATATVLPCPSQRIRNRPAQKHPAAEPKVLTAYSAPTEVPTLCDKRTV